MFGRRRLAGQQDGFTMMETLMAIFLIVLAFTSILPVYFSLTSYLTNNRLKAEAGAVAARDMEGIRAASYDDVGLVVGNPSGIFHAEKNESRANGGSFSIYTNIQWVDEPFDGTAAAGTDPMPNDYKLATVQVFETGKTTILATLTSNIARESEEQPITGGNILVKTVRSDGTTPISDVNIDITTGPSAPLSNWTGTDGTTIFAQITPSVTVGDYALRASKTGYIVRIDQEIQNTTVVFGQTRMLTFIMDVAGHLQVNLRDVNGAVIQKPSTLELSNADIGVVSYNATTGYFEFTELLPGNYEVKGSAAGFAASEAVVTTVVAGELTTVNITLEALPTGRLHLETFDSVSGLHLGNCAVKLTNQTNALITNAVTDGNGLLDIDIEVATYTVDITHIGYQPWTGSAAIEFNTTTNLNASLLGYPVVGSILVRAQDNSENPRNDVRTRVRGSGYYLEQLTGTSGPGEALYNDLDPGTYTVYRRAYYSWAYDRTVVVTAGNQSRVVYSF